MVRGHLIVRVARKDPVRTLSPGIAPDIIGCMQGYHLDPESQAVGECYAVIFAPSRGLRGRRPQDRFAENCVTVVASAEEAQARASQAKNFFPARVIGPARSSEGFRVFYLVGWLDPP